MNYTAEDEILIQAKWEALAESCKKICKNEEDWNFIKRAFFLAKEAHQGVRRRSGEPYFLHPIAVAQIVVDEIGLGVKSVVASLLHDVVEDTDYTVEDMEHIFGHKIATMVDGLTKMSGVFNADTSRQAEYFRKVLLTLSDDVRVILIKIADRLHNMRTLGAMPQNKQIKITGETMYLFAPLAYRLGLHAIKTELENLCMKYRFPKEYEEISRQIDETSAAREEYIRKFNAPIIEALDRNGIKYEISGRVKSAYSIWTKMVPERLTLYLPEGSKDQAAAIFSSVMVAADSFPPGTLERDAVNRAYQDTMRVLLIGAICIAVPIFPLALAVKNYHLDKIDQVRGRVVGGFLSGVGGNVREGKGWAYEIFGIGKEKKEDEAEAEVEPKDEEVVVSQAPARPGEPVESGQKETSRVPTQQMNGVENK